MRWCMRNWVKTLVLLVALSALFLYLGELFGGRTGLVIGFAFALVMNGLSYWYSDKIVLMAHRARPLSMEEAPYVHEIVERLARKAGIPKPRIYLVPTMAPNAFATGRNPRHAVVAVTEGLLRLLNRDELEGVLAHELSHVLNRDILVSTVAAVLASSILFISRIVQYSLFFFGWGSRDNDRNPLGLLLAAIIAPIVAIFLQLWVSRTREYMADESGAQLVGYPDGLISALQKIHEASALVPMKVPVESMSHLYFSKPRGLGWLVEWMSTHPPVEKRIERLKAMFYGSSSWRSA